MARSEGASYARSRTVLAGVLARAEASGADFVRHLRERARSARSRCRRTAAASSPSTRRTTGSRSSTSAPAASRTPASVPVGMEPVAVAVARRRRGLGRQPPLRQREHRRRRVDAAARDAHAARRRRAARHRVRRPGRNRAFITTAHRGQQRTHPSLAGVPGAGDPQLTTRRRRPRRRLGVRRGEPRHDARRHAAADRDALRRHAARARRAAPTATRSTPRSSTPATRRRSSTEGAVCDGFDAATPVHGRRRRRPAARAATPGPRTNFEGKHGARGRPRS